MKVKVIYPSDGSHEKSRIEFEVDVPNRVSQTAAEANKADHEYLLGEAWQQANFVEREDLARFQGYGKQNGVPMIRSAMVGDIFIVEGTPYVCDSAGWKEIDPRAVELWAKINITDRAIGYQWCIQKCLFDPRDTTDGMWPNGKCPKCGQGNPCDGKEH